MNCLNCSIIRTQHSKLLFLASDYDESDRKDKAIYSACQIILFFCSDKLLFYPQYATFETKLTKMTKRIVLPICIIALMCSCTGHNPRLAAIECSNIKIDKNEKSDGAATVRAILDKHKATIDSIKAPVIGATESELTAFPPESPLMNFAADALRTMAQRHSEEPIDIAITNKGGLRSTLPKGAITYGDIYNVFPFDNTLALLTLNGELLMQLFAEVAKVGGEAISGARLTITADGKLLDATVGNKPINPAKTYLIATSDYLSQGNDKLYTLGKGENKIIKSDITIRDLMIQYIAEQHSKGVAVKAVTDGRITIK